MHTVKIKNKTYSVLFSMRALSAFEQAAGIALASMDFEKMSLMQLSQLCIEGLRAGGYKAKKPLNDSEDAEWFLDAMDEDPGLLSKVIDAFKKEKKK